jgi:uncharacterized hydrophobic protein (TIGR00271 family)
MKSKIMGEPKPKISQRNKARSKPAQPAAILKITKTDQYRTIEELFAHAQENSSYYTLLMLSAFVVTAGLLLGNSAIVLGGVLVAPILTPILVVGLGFSTGEMAAIKSVLKLVFKSFALVIAVSMVLTMFFGFNQEVSIFENSSRTAILYFMVALASGIAAAFAWAKKEISEVLPGVSLAVTLVPPLSLVGIWLSKGSIEAVRFYSSVLLLNFFGIIIGSLIVFSLLKFSNAETKVQEEAQEARFKIK